MEYQKTCVHCKKPFTSTSKGTRYCSTECCDKHQKKVAHQREVQAKNGEISRITSRCYSMAHAVADFFLEKPADFKTEDYRLHHKNLNIFDNSPWNLVWLKHSVHEQIHSYLERVNPVTICRILLLKPDILEQNDQAYLSVFDVKEKHNELVHPACLELVSKYKIQNFTELDVESLFSDLESLKVKFMTLGPKTFGLKVFHVKGKTALREKFVDFDYGDLFDNWLEEAKNDKSISDSEVFGRK